MLIWWFILIFKNFLLSVIPVPFCAVPKQLFWEEHLIVINYQWVCSVMLTCPMNLSKAFLSWSLSICTVTSDFFGFGHISLSLNVSYIINLIQPGICLYSIQGSFLWHNLVIVQTPIVMLTIFCFKPTDHNQLLIPSRSAKICNMMLWYIPSAEAIPMGSCVNYTC